MPEDPEDFYVLMDRLAEYHGRGSWFDLLSQEEKDIMYENFSYDMDDEEYLYQFEDDEMQDEEDSEEFFIEFEGDEIASFEDLYELEEAARDEHIHKLVDEVQDYELKIQENTMYFNNNYMGMGDELNDLLDTFDNAEDGLADIKDMIEEAGQNIVTEAKESAEARAESEKMTPIGKSDSEKQVKELVKWFATTLAEVVAIGAFIGATCVCLCVFCHKKGQAKRLADAQANPRFRFADSTDPSGTASGIPRLNPIAADNLDSDRPYTNGDNT